MIDHSSGGIITEETASRIPSLATSRRASVMKRPARSPASRVIPRRPRPAGCGISPSVRNGPITADRPGPAADRWCWRSVGAVLVTLLVMLAPLGGPCDRGSRPADPTTMRSAAIGGPASGSWLSSFCAAPCAPPIEMYPDILEDEEDGEGCEERGLIGPASPFLPPPPVSL